MGDDILISTAGGDETIATNEIASKHYTKNRLIFGADGAVSGHVQLASTSVLGPLPVNAYPASDYVMVAGLGIVPIFTVINVLATTDTTLVTPPADKKVRVLSLVISKLTAGEVSLESTAGTSIFGPVEVLAESPIVLPFNPAGWFETNTGALLNLALTTGTFTAGGCMQHILV